MATENNTPDLEAIEKDLKNPGIRFSRMMFHMGTPSHSNKMRGVGITRKMKSKSKKNLRIEKNSRRRNRK
jgi:hypothetical protein